MLKVIVEKYEHGGFIAKQEGDNPLRYIAAAGDTEAAACAALFDYHADLIRKGHIEVSAVTPGVHPGDIYPDRKPVMPDEHGSILTKHMWTTVFELSEGLTEKTEATDVMIESWICYAIKMSFAKDRYTPLLFDQRYTKWMRMATKSLKYPIGDIEWSSYYSMCLIDALDYAKNPPTYRNACGYIANFFAHMFLSTGATFNMGGYGRYLTFMFGLDCTAPTISNTVPYTSGQRLPLDLPDSAYVKPDWAYETRF